MTVSSGINRASYSGNGSLTTFAYSFKVFDEGDLTVILRAADGGETTQTIVTNYTVTGVGDAGGGNVVFVTAPTATETIVILREQTLTQGLDLVPNDPFPANSLEDSLDKLTFMVQQHQEELDRSIKGSKTTTITNPTFTEDATQRANKLFAFDANGDIDISQEIGIYQGAWAAGTTYGVRDLVKDSGNDNFYICITAHTSSGSLPIKTNADIAKWVLIIDAEAAAASAAAALASQVSANASQTAAAASQVAAAASATAAQASIDSFESIYLGAQAVDPTVDLNGDPLTLGDWYFNTSSNVVRVYDGTIFVTGSTDPAAITSEALALAIALG